MAPRRIIAIATVEQLQRPMGSDMNLLVGLKVLENTAQELRPNSEFQSWFEQYIDHEETALFVARTAINSYNDATGQIIGYAASREQPIDDQNVLHVDGLFVRPTARGYSLGKRLVEATLQHAITRDASHIRVNHLPDDDVGHKLLHKMEFRRTEDGTYLRQLTA